MTLEEIAALKLSPAMRKMLSMANFGEPLRPGPTRSALMRRGLVRSMHEGLPSARGSLTLKGAKVREEIRHEDGLPW